MRKKVIISLFVLETMILSILIYIQNRNRIIHKQNIYKLKLDNGYNALLFFEDSLGKEFCSFSFTNDEKNSISIYASKYEIDDSKFLIFSDNFEDKNIVYAIKYSDSPQIIKSDEFFDNGIIFKPDEPAQ